MNISETSNHELSTKKRTNISPMLRIDVQYGTLQQKHAH